MAEEKWISPAIVSQLKKALSENVPEAVKQDKAYQAYQSCLGVFFNKAENILTEMKSLEENKSSLTSAQLQSKLSGLNWQCAYLCHNAAQELDKLAASVNYKNYIGLCVLEAIGFGIGAVLCMAALIFFISGIVLMAGGIMDPLSLGIVLGLLAGACGFLSGLMTYGIEKGLFNSPTAAPALSWGMNTFGVFKKPVQNFIQDAERIQKVISQDLDTLEGKTTIFLPAISSSSNNMSSHSSLFVAPSKTSEKHPICAKYYPVSCVKDDRNFDVRILELSGPALSSALEKFGDDFYQKIKATVDKYRVNVIMLNLVDEDAKKIQTLKNFCEKSKTTFGTAARTGEGRVVMYRQSLITDNVDGSRNWCCDGTFERNDDSPALSLSYFLCDKDGQKKDRDKAFKIWLEREPKASLYQNHTNPPRSGEHMVIVAPYLTDDPNAEEAANPGTYGVFYKKCGEPAKSAVKKVGIYIDLETKQPAGQIETTSQSVNTFAM